MADQLSDLERALSPAQLAALREMCTELHVPFDRWRTRPELRAFETVAGARLAGSLRKANKDISWNLSITEAARRIGLTYAALLKRMERIAKGSADVGQVVQTSVTGCGGGNSFDQTGEVTTERETMGIAEDMSRATDAAAAKMENDLNEAKRAPAPAKVERSKSVNTGGGFAPPAATDGLKRSK